MVSAFGPGLEQPVKTGTPSHFNVDCREAGSGDLEVTMTAPDGHDAPISLTDNEDGTYTVDFVAPQPGIHTVNLKYGSLKVPQCPLKVNVQPHVDVSKIKVEGLEPSKYKYHESTINSSAILAHSRTPEFNFSTTKSFQLEKPINS